MKILIESMTKVKWNWFEIRCWREETDYSNTIEYATRIDVDNALRSINRESTKEEVAKSLLELERMNAVEVLGVNNNGCVYYKDWP